MLTLGEIVVHAYHNRAVEPDMVMPGMLPAIRRFADRCAKEARDKYRLADYLRAEQVFEGDDLPRAEREAMAAAVVEHNLRRVAEGIERRSES